MTTLSDTFSDLMRDLMRSGLDFDQAKARINELSNFELLLALTSDRDAAALTERPDRAGSLTIPARSHGDEISDMLSEKDRKQAQKEHDQLEETAAPKKRNELTEAQAQWLEALEGSEWRQGKYFLWTEAEDGSRAYCCLGVACEMFDPVCQEMQADPESPYESYSGIASGLTAQKLHLRDEAGAFMTEARFKGGEIRSLSDATDRGANFSEVAAFIREYPQQVFTNFDAPEDAAWLTHLQK